MAYIAQLVDGVIVHKFELAAQNITLGRHVSNDIVLEDAAVSNRHARLVLEANEYFEDYLECFLEDLNSTNGTYVNDVRITRRQKLYHNDVIRLAWNQFKYVNNEEVEMEKTVHMLKNTRSR